jgi:hypothetical protein
MGKGLLVGFLDDLDFHRLSSGINVLGGELLARRQQLIDDPRAAAVGKGLFIGLFDNLDFHGRSSRK